MKKLVPVEKFMAVAIDNGYEVFTKEEIASYAKDFVSKSQSNSIFESQKEEFTVEMAGLQKAICLAEDGKETTLYYRRPLVDWKVDDNGIVMKGIAGIYTDTVENRKLDRVGKSYVPDPDVIKSIYGSEAGSESGFASVDEAMSAQAASIKKSCVALTNDANRRLAAGEIDEEVCKAVKNDIFSYFKEWGEVLDECGDVVKSTDYDDVKEDLADATAAFADIVKAAHGRYKDTAKNRRLHRVGQEYGKAGQKEEKPTEKQTASDEKNGGSRQEYYSKLKDFFDSADKKESLRDLKSLSKKFEKDAKGQLKVLKALQAFKAGASVDEAIKFADDSMDELYALIGKVNERTFNEGISPNFSKKMLNAAFQTFEDISYKKSGVDESKVASEKKDEKPTEKQAEQSEEERKAAEKRARRQERRRERHARKREEAAKVAKAAEEAKKAEQNDKKVRVEKEIKEVKSNDKKEISHEQKVKDFIKSDLDQKVYRAMRNFLDDFHDGGNGSYLKVPDYLNNGDFVEELRKNLPMGISLEDLGGALSSSVDRNAEIMKNTMTVREVEDVIDDGEVTFGPISKILDKIKSKGVVTTTKDIRDGLLSTSSTDGAYSDSVYVSIPGVFNYKAQMNGLNGGKVKKLYALQLNLKNDKTYRDFNQGKVNPEDIESAYLVRKFPEEGAYYEEDKNLDLNNLPIDIAPLR